ncbi:hypothetical protein, partial [Streptococcus sp. DD11]|uniref:hypothetical protein n=1 Tax=Streptococcus sp. DD11 TaxID=1777879 RepID=UPI0019D039AB
IVYAMYTRPDTRFAASSAILYFPLGIVNLILVQGSFYWLNCLWRVRQKKALKTQRIAPIYKRLKVLDLILLASYIPIWFLTFRENTINNAVIGILLWLFAIIEFINYFYYRLSYYAMGGLSLQIIRPFRLLFTGKAVKSQIAKEILLYKKKYRK